MAAAVRARRSPNDSSGWTTFASGSGSAPAKVSGTHRPHQDPLVVLGWRSTASTRARARPSSSTTSACACGFLPTTTPTTRWAMGEDRRAFHLRHDATEMAGFPLNLGSSGEGSPTLADIEGNGKLDTIIPTSDGSVHAIRPDGTEAPGFPVHTGPPSAWTRATRTTTSAIRPGRTTSSPSRGRDRQRGRGRRPQPHRRARHRGQHAGRQDVRMGRARAGSAGFPVLNGTPSQYGLTVPPPDTPYSFQPENVSFPSPVLADLEGNKHLDIIQAAGDNHVYAWRPDGTAVPGWPVSTLLPPGTVPAGQQQTHDSKVIPTPAIADINGDGIPDVVVGLDDSILGKPTLRAPACRRSCSPSTAAAPTPAVSAATRRSCPATRSRSPGSSRATAWPRTSSPGCRVAGDLRLATGAGGGGQRQPVHPVPRRPQDRHGQHAIRRGDDSGGRAELVSNAPDAAADVLRQLHAGAVHHLREPRQAGQPGANPGCLPGRLVSNGRAARHHPDARFRHSRRQRGQRLGSDDGRQPRPAVLALHPGARVLRSPRDRRRQRRRNPRRPRGGGFERADGLRQRHRQPAAGFPKWTGGWSLFAPATGDVNGAGATTWPR